MADITREEFQALVARVAALEGKAPSTPTTPTTPTTPPLKPKRVDVGEVKATVKGLNYTLTGDVTANLPTNFHYLQLAVRGPGAADLALNPNTAVKAGASKTLSATGLGQPGTYTTWIAYSLDGTKWVDGPKTKFSIKADASTPVKNPSTPIKPGAPVTGRKISLVGTSGLGFNSLVFRQSKADTEEFGRRRGAQMDGLLYFTGRQNWGDFEWRGDGQKDMLDAGLIVVTTMPHAPESEGDAMNARGGDDNYRQQQRDLGEKIAGQGFNRPNHVIRVDWEANGDWYAWSANRPGGPQALKQSIINYVTNLRAGGLDQVRFDLCWNQGPDQSGASFEFFPGPDYIDILGIDQYDMWWPTFDQEAWDKKMQRSPSVRTVAELAAKHGIMWAWDEGGNTHGDNNQGADNPTYWELARKEIERNKANMAWHVTYDDPGAPETLRHDFNSNPNSWRTYKQLWTP